MCRICERRLFFYWIVLPLDKLRHQIYKIVENRLIRVLSNVVEDIGMDYLGINYSGGDIYKTRFNPILAEYQPDILMNEYSYKKTRHLLNLGNPLNNIHKRKFWYPFPSDNEKLGSPTKIRSDKFMKGSIID